MITCTSNYGSQSF